MKYIINDEDRYVGNGTEINEVFNCYGEPNIKQLPDDYYIILLLLLLIYESPMVR